MQAGIGCRLFEGWAALWVGLLVAGCSFSGPGSSPDGAPSAEIDASVIDDIDAMPDESPWDEPDYAARIRFNVDNSTRENLDNFPLALRFPVESSMGGFGERIVFRDSEGRLSHQTEEFGETALVWVEANLPDQQVMSIWMYFDNETAVDLNSGPDTFSDFSSVYHFFDTFDPSNGNPVDDATGRNNLGAASAMSNSNTDVGIGRALSYTAGGSQYVATAVAESDFNLSDDQDLSYEAWFKVTADTTNRVIMANLNPQCRGMLLYIGDGVEQDSDGQTDVGDGLLIGTFLTANNCANTAGERTITASSGRVDDGNWHHVAYTVDRGTTATPNCFLTGPVSQPPARFGDEARRPTRQLDSEATTAMPAKPSTAYSTKSASVMSARPTGISRPISTDTQRPTPSTRMTLLSPGPFNKDPTRSARSSWSTDLFAKSLRSEALDLLFTALALEDSATLRGCRASRF